MIILFTMSSSCMIIVGWYIDKIVITFFATEHFHTGTNMHSFMYLSLITCRNTKFNDFIIFHYTHLEGKCAVILFVAYITKVIQMFPLMWWIVTFSSESWTTILALKSMWIRMYDHMLSQQWKLLEPIDMIGKRFDSLNQIYNTLKM